MDNGLKFSVELRGKKRFLCELTTAIDNCLIIFMVQEIVALFLCFYQQT